MVMNFKRLRLLEEPVVAYLQIRTEELRNSKYNCKEVIPTVIQNIVNYYKVITGTECLKRY